MFNKLYGILKKEFLRDLDNEFNPFKLKDWKPSVIEIIMITIVIIVMINGTYHLV